jgi:RNA polymerase sigma-70 factor, ECF subfamily
MERPARIHRVDVAEASRFGRLKPARRTSDAALVRAAQRGSERAVEELFARHWPDAYRTALLIAHDRAAAEDIAQEAFVSALRALPRFDRSRPLRPWLHRIVVNRAIDWARARRLRCEVDADAAPEAVAPEARDELGLGELGAALARLSPEHRAVVVMRYLLELTPGEIAAALDLPRGTVNSRLRRGLDALGGVLEDDTAPRAAPNGSLGGVLEDDAPPDDALGGDAARRAAPNDALGGDVARDDSPEGPP